MGPVARKQYKHAWDHDTPCLSPHDPMLGMLPKYQTLITCLPKRHCQVLLVPLGLDSLMLDTDPQLLWHHCSPCTCPASAATKTRYPPTGMLQPCSLGCSKCAQGCLQRSIWGVPAAPDVRTELLLCVNTVTLPTPDSVFTQLCYVLLSIKSVNDDKSSRLQTEKKTNKNKQDTCTKKYNQARYGISGL